ncbi:class I SAM-dependent methyltransferase [Microcoleus sp. FACHB-1515]|uniref:class I SAM-dependent methyltransferase n=1 Tax=Cyanophyceae TaxID=3028117 RepID=UPI001689DB0A|nr:class I SAM-dependent methyltransferase [Microcoleus sp. FACHB-1515]MBD2093513.1 class I SAM-dependent methyltransferase [Microcoleus sp. FACHB-1515]
MLNPEEANVAQHYSQEGFAYQSVRLQQYSPVEFAMTTRYLNRWVPNQAIVAYIGVGVGHYAELLAQRGCRLYLIDITQKLLDTTHARLKAADLEQQILAVQQASAAQLVGIENAIADVVLLLGPLYHLCSLSARQMAVQEAARILKPEGLLFAAGINRLVYFRDLFRNQPEEAVVRQNFHRQFLQNGNTDPDHAPPLGYGHLTTLTEFKQLFEAEFNQLAMIGAESFSAPFATTIHTLELEQIEAWVDLIEATGQTLEGLMMSDHFLYVGKKK